MHPEHSVEGRVEDAIGMSPWFPGKGVAGGGQSRSSQSTGARLPWSKAVLLLSLSPFLQMRKLRHRKIQ